MKTTKFVVSLLSLLVNFGLLLLGILSAWK